MSEQQLTPWTGPQPVVISPQKNHPADIVPIARQLSTSEQNQVIQAFNVGAHTMVSTFVWNRAIASLRHNLAKLGMGFIGEMLDRSDIDDESDVSQKLTDYEAIRLAEELGMVNGTGAFRLRQALERIHHFDQQNSEERESSPMTADEAVGVVRACVENVLAFERIERASDFRAFRDRLVERRFSEDDREVKALLSSPYFYHRTCLRALLALSKAAVGAQLENVLANVNLILPLIWEKLKGPDKWQIGRAYAEVFTEGKSKAASGLKSALIKVGGFDFVPEDLRSDSYRKAAQAVIVAHEGWNNFYNEPAPMQVLARMGSVIPSAALDVCMRAIICVRLGNVYGVSRAAQDSAKKLLSGLSDDRWQYFLDECLPVDERILYKLMSGAPRSRWVDLVSEFSLERVSSQCKNLDVRRLVSDSAKGSSAGITNVATKFVKKIGYRAN